MNVKNNLQVRNTAYPTQAAGTKRTAAELTELIKKFQNDPLRKGQYEAELSKLAATGEVADPDLAALQLLNGNKSAQPSTPRTADELRALIAKFENDPLRKGIYQAELSNLTASGKGARSAAQIKTELAEVNVSLKDVAGDSELTSLLLLRRSKLTSELANLPTNSGGTWGSASSAGWGAK